MKNFLYNFGLCIIFGIAHSITTIIMGLILVNQYTPLFLSFSESAEKYFQPMHIFPMIILAIATPIIVIAFSKEQYLLEISKNKNLGIKILDTIVLSLIFGVVTTSGLVYLLYSQLSIHQTIQSFALTVLATTIGFAGMKICENMYAIFKK